MKINHWIFISGVVVLTIISLLGCRGQAAGIPQPFALTPGPTLIGVAVSPTPSPVSSPPPTSSLTLPVLAGTPVPLPNEPITPDNVGRIQQLAMWGKGQVKQVTYSADGKFLIVGSTAGLWLYDAKTLELLRFMQTTDEIMDLIFLPDSETVMTRIGGNTIIRWNGITGTLLGSWQIGVKGLIKPIFAPDGTRLASVLENGQIGLWEIETGRLLKTFHVETDVKPQVGVLAFSPDSKLLASETLSHSATINVRLWDVATGKLLHVLPESSKTGGAVASLAFSPDNTQLVSGESSIRLWKVETGELLKTLSGGGGRVLTFSPDGTRLAAVDYYEALYIWNIKSAKIEHTLATKWISALAFSPTGDTLVSGGGDDPPQLWSSSTGESLGVLNGFGDSVIDLAVSPDGSIFTTHRKGNFLLTGETSNGVRVWDVPTGQVTHTVGSTIPAYRLALSANGHALASVEHEGVYNTGENPVRIWEATTGRLLQTIGGHSLGFALAVSPDGRLVTISRTVHDVQTGEILYELELSGGNGQLWNTIFSPDGTKLAAGQESKRVAFLWEANSGKQLYLLESPVRYFGGGIAFSPDNKILAIGYGEDNTIRLWQVETGRNLQTLAADGNDTLGLDFSRDGVILASSAKGSRTTQLWANQTGQLLRTIDTSGACIIHFTNDGRLLILQRWRDGIVQLWGIPPK